MKKINQPTFNHVPLSDVTQENIRDVFAYCNVGGKMRLLRRVPTSFDSNALTLEFMSPPEFRNAFLNKAKKVRIPAIEDPNDMDFDKPAKKDSFKKVSIADLYLTNPARITFDRLVFEADRAAVRPTDYNLWQGFTVTPKKGKWDLMQAMMLESLADNDFESYIYIRNWVAWAVQNPTRRAETALVLRSEKQGTGKGILGNAIRRIFGAHSAHLYRQDALTARFNSQLAMCAFLFDDESTFSGDKAAANMMKGLITEPTIDIERKGVDTITLANSLKIMKATNSTWSAPVEAADRRYAIFNTSERWANDRTYFGPIVAQMNERGGLEAMLYDLLHLDLKGFHPRDDIPKTEARAEQQALSLPPEELWMLGFLESGILPYTNPQFPNRVGSQSRLYEDARRRTRGLSYWTDVQFAKHLDKWGVRSKRSNGTYRDFSSLQELRAKWLAKYPWYRGFEGLAADEAWTFERDEHDDTPDMDFG